MVGRGGPGPEFRLGMWLGGFLLVHLYLVAADYYELLPAVDMPMHLLGGALVAGAVRLMLRRRPRQPGFPSLYLVGGALLVGLVYEGFELAAAHYTDLIFVAGPRDTIRDLVFDGLGAAIVALYVRFRGL